MNRRCAVLGLAAAMCGTAVAGQTAAPKDVPAPAIVAPMGQTSPTTAPVPIQLSPAEWRDYYATQHRTLMALSENAGGFGGQTVQTPATIYGAGSTTCAMWLSGDRAIRPDQVQLSW